MVNFNAERIELTKLLSNFSCLHPGVRASFWWESGCCYTDFCFHELTRTQAAFPLYSLCVSHLVVSNFCNSMVCSPSGSSHHGILQARILEWIAIHLQWIFLTEGSNPGLLHCRQILYHLSYGEVPLYS